MVMRMASWNRCEISMMECPDCGKFFPIPRNKGRRRSYNHIKDLWCAFCKAEKTMLEFRPNTSRRNLAGEYLEVI